MRFRPFALIIALPILLTAQCSGKTEATRSSSSDDAGTPAPGNDGHPGDDASTPPGDDADNPPGTDASKPTGDDASPKSTVCAGRVPVHHRDHAVACSPTPFSYDAGVVACTTDADCGDGGAVGGVITASHCLQGQCSPDDCLSDSDCPNNQVCSCSPATRGYAGSTANRCVSGNCETDADCATGSYCSPSDDVGGPFYGTYGYYCHSCADSCTDDTDCSFTCFGTPWCAYDTTVGHWACGTSCAAG